MVDVDLDRTLEELEGARWPAPSFPSALVLNCHRIAGTPRRELTAEDLRLMIGQELGLPFLVPLAIERLRVDPATPDTFFPGDLLFAILRLPADFWTGRRGLHRATREAADGFLAGADAKRLVAEDERRAAEFRDVLARFRANAPRA